MLKNGPNYNATYLEKSTINLVIQLKGKKVDVMEVDKSLDKAGLEAVAMANDKLRIDLMVLKLRK